MGDTPQTGQAVPAGEQSTPAAAQTTSDSGGFKPAIPPEMMQQILKMAQLASQPHLQMTQPPIRPKAQHTSLGQDIGVGVTSMFLPFLGGAIKKYIMNQKKAQVQDAQMDYKQLDDGLEKAWIQSGGDQEKALKIWEASPEYQNIFNPHDAASKKKAKNYAKVFQVDWQNPEKTTGTAAYQGLQEFMKQKPQSKLIQALGQQMSGAKNIQQGAQQMAGGGQPGGMQQRPPMHMSQVSPQILEQLLKMGQQGQEFKTQQDRLRQEHAENLAARIDNYRSLHESRESNRQMQMENLQLRRDQFKDKKEYEAKVLEMRKEHEKQQREEFNERLDLQRELGQISKQIALDRLEMTGAGKLKTEYKAGLNVLHTSLFGSGDPAKGGTPGLVDSLWVLDSFAHRAKLSTLGQDFLHPTEGSPGMLGGLKRMMESGGLDKDDRAMIAQLNRAVSAINSLRSITGLPRATQSLMDRYIMELPSAMMDANSEEAMNKIQLIQREITAAMDTTTQAVAAGKTVVIDETGHLKIVELGQDMQAPPTNKWGQFKEGGTPLTQPK